MNAPLTERDYAEIRAAVMSRIRQPERRRSLVPALAFASLIVVFVSFSVARRPVVAPPVGVPRVATPAVQLRPPTPPAPSLTLGVTRPPRRHKPHHRKPEIQLATVRMDIQTPDPDVRIIWFAR